MGRLVSSSRKAIICVYAVFFTCKYQDINSFFQEQENWTATRELELESYRARARELELES